MTNKEIIDLLFILALAVVAALQVWDLRRQMRRRKEYDAIVEATLAGRIGEAAELSKAYLARWVRS